MRIRPPPGGTTVLAISAATQMVSAVWGDHDQRAVGRAAFHTYRSSISR